MEEYISIKDFAKRAEISVQSAYKQTGTRLKPYVKNHKGQKVISVKALAEFYGITPEEKTTTRQLDLNRFNPESTEIQPESTEKFNRNQPDSTKNNPVEQTDSTTTKALEIALEALRTELETKNRQLEEKDRQINSLLQTVNGLSENLKTAQALAAGDKKKLFALEAKEEQEAEKIIDPVTAQSSTDTATGNTTAAPEAPETEKKGFFSFFRKWL